MEDLKTSPTAPEYYRKEENKDSKEEPEEEKVVYNHLKKQKACIQIDVQIEGDDAVTLTTHTKVNGKFQNKPFKYQFPTTRLKIARSSSSNSSKSFGEAVGIIFCALGWMLCDCGLPFISLASLIIGCIYINDCKIQPNIPVYLMVSGVLGTIQRFIAVWKEDRISCWKAVDCILQLFLTIWFVLGCIWVYRVYNEVEYQDLERNEYCNQTLYLYAFWTLNFSFMILALVPVIALLTTVVWCCLACID